RALSACLDRDRRRFLHGWGYRAPAWARGAGTPPRHLAHVRRCPRPRRGRRSNFVQAVPADVPLQMGTLSKALGSYGGYVCASAAVVELIRNRARTAVYSTALPPAMAGAALAALDVIEREPGYAALPLAKARAFARRAGLPEPASPIVPVVLGEAGTALDASRMLADEGFLVVAIRPPT